MNNSYTVELKYLIYRSFVKYDILQRLVYETFGNSSIASTTELNIYVDLYSICKPIFSENNRTIIEDYTELTTELINLCAHYRSFFKKLSVRTKFYLVWSKNICDINRKLVPGYNEVFFNKSKIKIFDDFINNNLDLLEIIVPYLPDIFFIRSIKNYESSVIISSLIDTVSGGIPNLIISNDTYPLQLTAIHPNTCLLVPIKYLQEDDSFMVPINEKNNFREKFWGVLNIINEHKSESSILQTISPINFPLFFSLIGMKKRNVKMLFNINKSSKLIYYLIKGQDIKISIDQLKSDPEIGANIPLSIIESRYNAFDINFCKAYYMIDPEFLSLKFENLQDNSVINYINSKFFSNNPIEVNKL